MPSISVPNLSSTVDKLSALSKAIPAAQSQAMIEGGKVIQAAIETSVRTSVPSMRFRNMRGARLAIKTTTSKSPGTTVTLQPSGSTGAWSILEHGSKDHVVTGKKGRGSRRKRRNAVAFAGFLSGITGNKASVGRLGGPIKIPGIGWKMYSRPRGVHGQPKWETGLAAGREPALALHAEHVARALAEVF